MKYSKKTKREFVVLLKGTRLRIANRSEDFVCNAIENTHMSGVSKATVSKLLDEITDRLDGYATVRAWLDGEHGICLKDEEAYRYRLAWIDSMIQEFGG